MMNLKKQIKKQVKSKKAKKLIQYFMTEEGYLVIDIVLRCNRIELWP